MKNSVRELIPILQIAIGPVILISGVGLLLLTMTNRLGRVVDRSRLLARERRQMEGAGRVRCDAQIAILVRRARLIRLAILLAGSSVLLAALLIIVLFLTALLGLEDAWLIAALFVAGMLSLIGALVAFLLDINLSLVALELEVAADSSG